MELVPVGVKRESVAHYRKFDFGLFVTTIEMVGEYSNHLALRLNSIIYTRTGGFVERCGVVVP